MTDEEKRINEEESAFIDAQLSEFDEDDIVLTPAILPYSYWRIKAYLLSNGIEMLPFFRGYKNPVRYIHHQYWVLVDMYDNTIIGDERGYTLYALRVCLSNMHVPLHDKDYKPTTLKSGRRLGCIRFLEAIERAEKEKRERSNE